MVIPVWGFPYAETLPRAIASVRSQSETAPIVVVDNASATPLPDLPYASVVVAPRRLSAGSARNLGMHDVHTEYVVFLDADDELVGGALEILRNGISADPGLAAYVMSIVEAESGNRHRFPHRFAFGLSRLPRLFAVVTAVWSLYPTQGCAILRSDWVRHGGGYANANFGEDWVLAVSQAFRGAVCLDRRLGRIYHQHSESLLGDALGLGQVMFVHKRIRERLRVDPAVPVWARGLLPLISVLQLLVIVALAPYRALGSLGAANSSKRTSAPADRA